MPKNDQIINWIQNKTTFKATTSIYCTQAEISTSLSKIQLFIILGAIKIRSYNF